jgi:hypothetical protein
LAGYAKAEVNANAMSRGGAAQTGYPGFEHSSWKNIQTAKERKHKT